MLIDKDNQSAPTSSEHKKAKEPLIDLKEVKKIKAIELDTSSGFICDINTGICGPVNQKKEGNK